MVFLKGVFLLFLVFVDFCLFCFFENRLGSREAESASPSVSRLPGVQDVKERFIRLYHGDNEKQMYFYEFKMYS